MRSDLFVALTLIFLTHVRGQNNDCNDKCLSSECLNCCLKKSTSSTPDFTKQCHNGDKFKGPVCRGFMYIFQAASYELPYLTLCHLRALENCTIFDGTIVINIDKVKQKSYTVNNANVESCLYRHLNASFEVPKRLNSLIEKGGINVDHAGFHAELQKHKIFKYTKNLVEITGALYVSRVRELQYKDIEVESLGQLFPSLRIIRGNSYGYKQSLYLAMNRFRKVRLENLVAIVRNGVKLEGDMSEKYQLQTYNIGPSGSFRKLLLDKDAEIVTTKTISESANCQNVKDPSDKNSFENFCYEKSSRDNKDTCWDKGPLFPESNATLQSYYCQIDVDRVNSLNICNSLCLGGCKYPFVKEVPPEKFAFTKEGTFSTKLTPLQNFTRNAESTSDAPIAVNCAGCDWTNSVSFIHESWRGEYATVCFSRKLNGKYCDADLDRPNYPRGCVEPVTFYHGCPAEFPWRAGELVSDLDDLYPDDIHGWRCVSKEECYDLYSIDGSRTIFHCDDEKCISGSCQGPSITSLGKKRIYKCNEIPARTEKIVESIPEQENHPNFDLFRCKKGYSQKETSLKTDFLCTKCYDKCETYVCDFCGYTFDDAELEDELRIFDEIGLKAIVGCEKIRTNGGMVIAIKDQKLTESINGGLSKVDKAFQSLREIDCLTIKGADALTSLSFLNLTSVAGKTWKTYDNTERKNSVTNFTRIDCTYSKPKTSTQIQTEEDYDEQKIKKPSYPVKIQQNPSLQTLFAKNMDFSRSARVYILIKGDIKFSLGIKHTNMVMLNRATGAVQNDISTRVSGISENDFLCPNEYIDLHKIKKMPNGKHISKWENLIKEYETKNKDGANRASKTLVLFLITEEALKKLYLDDLRTRNPDMPENITFEKLYESQPRAVKKAYTIKQLVDKIFIRTRYWLHETLKLRHNNGHQAVCDVFPVLDANITSKRISSEETGLGIGDINTQIFEAMFGNPVHNPVLESSMGMTINEVVKFLKPEPFNKICWDSSATQSQDGKFTPICAADPIASCSNPFDEPWIYKYGDLVINDGPNLFYIEDKDERNFKAETRLSLSKCISTKTYNMIGENDITVIDCYTGDGWDPCSDEYSCNKTFAKHCEKHEQQKCNIETLNKLEDNALVANTKYTAYLEATVNFGEDDRLDTNKKIIFRSNHTIVKTEVDVANGVIFPERSVTGERSPDKETTTLSINFKVETVTGVLKDFVIAYNRWTNNIGFCPHFETLDSMLKTYETVTVENKNKMLEEVYKKCARMPVNVRPSSGYDPKNTVDSEFEMTVPKTSDAFPEENMFCRLNEKEGEHNGHCRSESQKDSENFKIQDEKDPSPEGSNEYSEIDDNSNASELLLDTNLTESESSYSNDSSANNGEINTDNDKYDDEISMYDYEDYDSFDSGISDYSCNNTCIFNRLSNYACDFFMKYENGTCKTFFPNYENPFSAVSFAERINQILNYTQMLYPQAQQNEIDEIEKLHRAVDSDDKSTQKKDYHGMPKKTEFRLNSQKRLYLLSCAECFLKIEKAVFDVGLTDYNITRVIPTVETTTTGRSGEISTDENENLNDDNNSDMLPSSSSAQSSTDSSPSFSQIPGIEKRKRRSDLDYTSSSQYPSESTIEEGRTPKPDKTASSRPFMLDTDLSSLKDLFDEILVKDGFDESARKWETPLEDLPTGKTILYSAFACNEGTDCRASEFMKALQKCSENDPSCEETPVTFNMLNQTFSAVELEWENILSNINRTYGATMFNTKPFKLNDCPRGDCVSNEKTWVPSCLTENGDWDCNNVVNRKLELVFQAPDWRKQNGYVLLYEFEFTKEGGDPKSVVITDHLARKYFAEKVNESTFWKNFQTASSKDNYMDSGSTMEQILNFKCLDDPSKPPEKWYTLTESEQAIDFAFKVIRGEERCYLCSEPKVEWPWCDPDFCGFRMLNLDGEEKSHILDRGEFEFQIRIYTTSTLFQWKSEWTSINSKDLVIDQFKALFQTTSYSRRNVINVKMKTIVVEISLFCVLLVVVSAFVAIWFKQRHKKPYMTMEWTVNPDCFEPDLAQRDAYYAAGAGGAQVKAEFYINVEDLTAPEEMTYIGTGNYGDIYLAEFKDPEEKNCIHKVAVKFFKDVQDTKKIHKEREAFQTLGRTGGFYHITYYFGWSYINHPSIPMMSTCLVMEYMDCKSLNHYLRTYNPEKNTSGRRADESITIKRLLKMCADVADGMFFLNEELKFIHRDLAARNCLVARHEVNGEVYETVKISDFGLTRSMINDDNKDYYCLDINYIPIRWWPPESIEGGKFMSLGDIWSYGVLLFEIITLGCLPYVDISNAEVKAEIMRNIELNTHEFNVLSKKCWRDMILKSLLAVGIPAKEAEDAYNNITKLIKICCHYEPTKRPTFRDLLDMIAQFDQLNGLKDFQEEYFFYKGRQDESYSIESDCETESTTVNYEATDVVKPLLDSNS